MQEYQLATKSLCKKYNHNIVLHPTNISIKKGEIYGLVGKNGAGKTTLIRLLTGHILPTSGAIELFGENTPKGLYRGRRRIGALVETPSFFPYLSAKQNLEYYRLQMGIVEKNNIDKILDNIDLDTSDKKFKNFSLGMKQKLGIALALINNPDILILDEPINGLDPIGIVKIRHLLKKLNEENNLTILISSHILSELDNLATRYGFIDDGKIIKEISSKELHNKCKKSLEIVVDNCEKTAAILETKLNLYNYEILPNNKIIIQEFLDDPRKISKIIVDNNIGLYSININILTLEKYFINLIGGKKNV